MKIQDRENIKNIFDMFNGQHSKQLIETLYVKNGKNFEKTLEQFLTGNIPKDEYKVVVIPEPTAQTTHMIDTSSVVSKPDVKSDLLQSYMLGSFEGSKARKNKNRQYYE